MKLAKKDQARLIALLGMMGAASDGERGAAALHVERFRREHKFTWEELLADQHEPPAPPVPYPYPPSWRYPARRRFFRTGVVVIGILDIFIVVALVGFVTGLTGPRLIGIASAAIVIVAFGWPLRLPLRYWWGLASFRAYLGAFIAFVIGVVSAILAVISLLSAPD